MNDERIIRIAVCGAAGRMGRRIIACASERSDTAIAGAFDMPGCPCIGQDSGLLAGIGENKVIITSDAAAALAPADVMIEFALPAGVAQRVALCSSMKKAMVIGTTGVDAAGKAAVAAAAKIVPVIHAPNFSVGVNLLFALTKRAAQVLDEGYDVEIIEMHHRRKQDAPSGTALRLADMVESGMAGRALRRVHGRQGDVGARPADELAIHAVRGGDVVGDHTVIFAAEGERIELTHKAGSRDTFATGALRAAVFLARAKPGLYTMADVLGM